MTFFAGSQQSDRVVLVVTTEADINRFGYPIRDNDLYAVLARVFAGAPKAVGVDLYRDLPMPPGNPELQAIQRAQGNLYWVFKLPDEGNIGVPPPPALRETGREVLSDHVTDAGGVVRRALLLAADERTGTNWRTMGVALAERYTGQQLRPMDDDLALGQGRIPLLEPALWPLRKSGCRWLPDAVRLTAAAIDASARSASPRSSTGRSWRRRCATALCWSAPRRFRSRIISLRRSVPAGAGRER